MIRNALCRGLILWTLAHPSPGLRAQQDRLEGLWQGTVQTLQGERPVRATFKRDAGSYTGTITGIRGDMAFKELRLEGDKLFATAEVETPQAVITVKFDLTLQGESLTGKGEAEFGGQTFVLDYNLKRVGDLAAAAATPPAPQQAQGQQRRESVPQPTQPAELDYFAGEWEFKWIGRESALSPGGPREGITTCSPVLDGKYLECRTEGKSETGAYRELSYLGFDPAHKRLTVFQQRSNGMAGLAIGDWSSPVAIRFVAAPVAADGQKLELKRTINVVAAHSFTLVEEMSINGGPLQRLGNAVYSKILPEKK